MEESKRGRGRPKVDGVTKNKRVVLKMTYEEFERLSRIGEMSGKTKSDVLRKGIEICESMAKAGCSLDLND